MNAIVVDTSAIMAILLREDDAEVIAAALVEADEVLISAATVMEASIVSTRLTGSGAAVARMISTQPLTVVAFDAEQLDFAQAGFARFGKGRHPAGLNFGDCFAYALARSRDLPLLWKGDDFGRTDVVPALRSVALGQSSK